jgi:hypothetical protein
MVTPEAPSAGEQGPRRYESIPPALWAIALSALAPFPVSAVLYAWGPPSLAAGALTVILTWSGCVLAFLGGVRWGLESGRPVPRAERLLISVLSPVVAWILLAGRHRIGDGWIVAGCIAAFLVQ